MVRLTHARTSYQEAEACHAEAEGEPLEDACPLRVSLGLGRAPHRQARDHTEELGTDLLAILLEDDPEPIPRRRLYLQESPGHRWRFNALGHHR
jgi:hypothetical protein